MKKQILNKILVISFLKKKKIKESALTNKNKSIYIRQFVCIIYRYIDFIFGKLNFI